MASASAAPGKRTLIDGLVQLRAEASAADAPADPATVQDAAARGTAGSGGALPFGDRIQASFGAHDLSGVRAHTGDDAADAADEMDAIAFTSGDNIAFGDEPDLHTAAHEAAHVVQQRAGVHLAGGVGAAGDPYEQHADAVADRVVAGQSAEALLDQMAPSSARGGASGVQRKVYISNSATTYRRKTGRTTRGAAVKTMMADKKKSFYFDSKPHLSSYVDKATTDVGMVEKGGPAWIKLPTEFTVFGEDHSKTTLRDLVVATGTDRYAHEGFTAMPADQPDNAALSTALGARATELGAGMRQAPDASNTGEAFMPKVLRQLAELRINDHVVGSNDHGERGLWYAILYAKGAAGEIRALYDGNQALLDPIAAASGKVADTLSRDERRALKAFVDRFVALGTPLSAAEHTGMPDEERAHFDRHWQADGSRRYVSEGTTNAAAKDRADDARDASMYKQIKQAKAGGKLLFGVGDNHRLRLARLLEADAIRHTTVDAFVAEQKTKYPQR